MPSWRSFRAWLAIVDGSGGASAGRLLYLANVKPGLDNKLCQGSLDASVVSQLTCQFILWPFHCRLNLQMEILLELDVISRRGGVDMLQHPEDMEHRHERCNPLYLVAGLSLKTHERVGASCDVRTNGGCKCHSIRGRHRDPVRDLMVDTTCCTSNALERHRHRARCL